MPDRKLVVADCGLGNIHSLLAALRRLAAPDERVELTANPRHIERADAVFLPGDGSFGACVAEIDGRDLRSVLVDSAASKPFFAICVGMQVLFEASQEAPQARGLGVLDGQASRFPAAAGIKVPLMGWLDVQTVADRHPVFASVSDGDRFYFLHSYFLPATSRQVALTGQHSSPFAAAVAAGRLVATQFHPEKSHAAGLALIEKFLELARTD
ncbi:MAG: imidazole glycerol phosphate synthase subunit HisH [Betaproteobacteria bacterium]|nr:imidazole glycerol phosphate synthase subunit HisH [Betaproteobacteria bacterium]